jgi:hypothetical protein
MRHNDRVLTNPQEFWRSTLAKYPAGILHRDVLGQITSRPQYRLVLVDLPPGGIPAVSADAGDTTVVVGVEMDEELGVAAVAERVRQQTGRADARDGLRWELQDGLVPADLCRHCGGVEVEHLIVTWQGHRFPPPHCRGCSGPAFSPPRVICVIRGGWPGRPPRHDAPAGPRLPSVSSCPGLRTTHRTARNRHPTQPLPDAGLVPVPQPAPTRHARPEPRSLYSHRIPVCSRYKIPHSTARSGNGSRPRYRNLRSHRGSSGSTRFLSSSDTIHGDVPTPDRTLNSRPGHGNQG